MDGLEAVEIKLGEIKRSVTVRMDSDYYKKKYVNQEQFIGKNASFFASFKDLDLSVDASAFYPALEPHYGQGDIPFIRVADIKKDIDYDGCVKIPEMGADFRTLRKCSSGDIVLTKGGTVGKTGLIRFDSYVTRDLIFINSSIMKRTDYISLFLLLKTNFMYDLMVRSSSLSVQPHLTITLIRDLPIFIFSNDFKEKLLDIYNLFENILDQSKKMYQSAETLLLSHLGLNNYTPSSDRIAIKTLSQSFATSGRLDSEYYQPKYEEIMQAISVHRKKSLSGDNGLVDIKKSIEPGSDFYGDVGVPFVRVSNLSKYELSEPDIRIPIDTIDGMEKLYPKKDTILLSKDGSVGIAYKVEQDLHCVTSGAILHLTIRDTAEILPDFLTLVLNSKVVQMQAERDAGGSIIQHWKPSEIAEVVIPVLDMGKQLEISDKLQESFALRKKSAELLELAKTAVEVAIEQGEEKALAMLEEVTL